MKEAIYIRQLQADLNRDGGQYNLPYMLANILQSYGQTQDETPRCCHSEEAWVICTKVLVSVQCYNKQ